MKAHKKKQNRKRPTRRWWLLGVIIVVTLAVVLIIADMTGHLLGTNSPEKESAIKHDFSYGIALGYTLPPLNQSQRIQLLDNIKKAGFSEVRFNLDWSEIQSQSKNKLDWTESDAIMKAVKDSGLKSVITLDRTPMWARPSECKTSIFCPPTDLDAFAKFSGVAVERYRSQDVVAWEIWNEPNIVEFWKPFPNPNQYAHMLKTTYTAIKKQDPKAVVLVGGLAGNSVDSNGVSYIDPRTFLGQLYAAGAGKFFDGIAYHPYTGLRLPTVSNDYNGWYKLTNGKSNVRNIMIANGDTQKDVWLTEFGAPTDGPGSVVTDITAAQIPKAADHLTLESQNQITAELIKSVQKYSWIRNLDWYTYKDSSGPMSDAGGSYGLFQADGTPKPAYETLEKAMQKR